MNDDEAPEGYEYRWVPTNELQGGKFWVVLAKPTAIYLCRGKHGCKNSPVAKLNRSHTVKPRWWYYCPDHLYGKRIVGVEMQSRVLREVAR